MLICLGALLAAVAPGFVVGAEVPVVAAKPRFTGMPFMRTWLAQDYAASPTNRGVQQHPQTGFLYFSNAGGLLEFDGTRWRLYRAPDGSGVASVAFDARGRVWFNSERHVGYLAPDARGELQPVSALAQLPADEPGIFPLGRCVATEEGIYYTSGKRVIRFSAEEGGRARVWHCEEGELTGHIWLMAGLVHVRGPKGVLQLREDGLHAVPELRTFSFVTRPAAEGGWQMINRDGLRRWDGGYRPVTPGMTGLVSALEGDAALCGIFLRDGRIAFGTTRSGVVVCDRLGRRLQVIDRAGGLLTNRIEGLCEDREGGLWVACRNGIARLQLDSPYARHGTGERRIDSTPTALALHDGELFLGGGEGLWRRDRAGEFHPIAEVQQYVRSIVSLGGQAYVTGTELRRVEPEATARLLDIHYYGLVALSTAPGIFAHGNRDGLVLSRFEHDRAVDVVRYHGIRDATAVVAEWPAGVIWAAGHNTGLWRIDFRGGVRAEAPAKNYSDGNPLLADSTQYNVELFHWAGGFGGSVANRLVRYDETEDRFVAEARIDGLRRSGEGAVALAPIGVKRGADGTLWLQPAAGSILHVVAAGADRWRAEVQPGPGLPQLHLTTMLPDEGNRTLWIAGASSLISRDLDWRPAGPPAALAARVRRVETARGDLVWADSDFGGAGARRFALDHTQRALRIRFTAPSFTGDHLGRSQLQFRTRLEGLDAEWTAWTTETQRDFTNLPYRDFTFRVEARDDQGRTSPAATLAFAVTPPWWLARWVFAGYGLLGIAGVFGLVRWRTHALRRRGAQLEAVIATRTEDLRRRGDELRESNAELARLNAVERDEKLAAKLDEEKARLEMLRYQLNPHFLYNTLASICGTARSNPEATRTMAQRLADFCRLTLTRDGEMETVREELRMLRSYLDIEQARWRDSLQIEIEAAGEVLDERLPTFLLLPLVENAIKHGGRSSPDVLRLRIAIRRAATGAIAIEVANTGVWDTHTPNPASTGIGLENLRRRLARHFAGTHTFGIGPEGEWVVARLTLSRSK